MERYAIMFRVKPGTEDKVKELLAGYPPPNRVTPDGTELVSTTVFMKDQLVIRMIEIDGSLPSLMAHISREPSIQKVEEELHRYLVDEDKRDASTPEGARDFFLRAMMEHVTTRRADS